MEAAKEVWRTKISELPLNSLCLDHHEMGLQVSDGGAGGERDVQHAEGVGDISGHALE